MAVPADDPITPAELAEWRQGLGRSETRRQILDVESLRRFAAAVGADLDVERRPPPLAHWAFFLEAIARRRLGSDGHALRDRGLLPPVRLPRRMFAATRVEFCEPLTLGMEAELSLTLAAIEHRVQANGELIFVDVDRRLWQGGVVRVIERQTLVYRAADHPSSARPPAARQPAAPQPAAHEALDGEEAWLPTTVDLFRFSAATFNAHRIHYDLAYARDAEGYPDLVVQGPLTAVKLLAFAQSRLRPAAMIASFSFRATAPLFVAQPVRFVPGNDPTEVRAIRCDGLVAMTGVAITVA
jgi:3-methylfumaryl-CoA hydratase